MYELSMTPKRIKCSNKECNHVFEIVDALNPLDNDPGYVIKKCPKCGAMVRFLVCNTDLFDRQPDTKWVCELEDLDEKTLAVPEGKELLDESIINKPSVWSPSDLLDFWEVKGKNRAITCDKQVQRIINEIDSKLNCAYQAHMAGQLWIRDPKWIFLKTHEPQKARKYGVYAKPIRGDNDFNSGGLHMIHHSGVNLSESIDGLYTRDNAIAIMNTCFKRWDAIGRLIIVATPFVGFPQNTQRNRDQIIRYWKWLGDVLDMDKTVFITRKSTFTLRRNIGAERSEDVEFLKEWGKLDRLTNAAEVEVHRRNPRKKKNASVLKRSIDKFPAVLYNEKFHAKFYAGIIDDTVEVLVGSYNVHEGVGLENLSFKCYELDDFLAKYTKRLLPDIDIKVPDFEDTQIVFGALDEKGVLMATVGMKKEFLVQNKLI